MSLRSIPAVLRTCARLQPNDPVFTFMDYEQDWEGVRITLTWSQLYRRTLNMAQELNRCGSTGDRVAISAPQGLDYVVAFLGALQAGRIAVPLSVPQGGVTDERFESVLNDSSPVAILTTSPVVDDVVQHVTRRSSKSMPLVMEVDLLDLDSPNGSGVGNGDHLSTAYLQYTSGSTRTPAGVIISHHNLRTNFEQLMSTYFADTDGVSPAGGMSVSWLPFYHDMGLIMGVCAPILGGCPALLTSPVSFLQRPARWMHMLASEFPVFSAAPNFAFELATRKISDNDMTGIDLGNIHFILNGSERVQPATIKRFNNRFARFNLKEKALRPSYGLAEATVYVTSSKSGQPAELVNFDAESLSTGQAKPCTSGSGTPLISYVLPPSPIVRIVDADTCIECQNGTVGEIWVHGDNVANGYWQKPDESERTFGGKIVSPSKGTPEGPWLRTGDSGFVIDGKMFIIGRIKDLLIVYGRNHSPEDIEATIQEISRGRCAAISIPDRNTEKLVAIIELKKLGDTDQYAMDRLSAIKREVISALSSSHGLSVADIVLVAPGSIPITTSGKVRRSTCVERYRQDQFDRIDA